MFDEMSTLHYALTDLCLLKKARVLSKIRFKLDTGTSGNLLLVSPYHRLFPDYPMKDPGMAIDPSIELLTTTKSSINSLALYISEFITPNVILHTLVYFCSTKHV